MTLYVSVKPIMLSAIMILCVSVKTVTLIGIVTLLAFVKPIMLHVLMAFCISVHVHFTECHYDITFLSLST
jgi:hypothetical protein